MPISAPSSYSYHEVCLPLSLLLFLRSSSVQSTNLIGTKTDSRPLIPCILSFVTGTLRPVKSETDPHLSPWYKSHSRIYVSPEHSCWTDPESAKKVRKNRFGGVRASEVAGLNAMMATYLNEGTEWVDEMVRMRYAELGMGEAGKGGDETESEGRE